jgi:hypothetical protein
MQQELLQQHRPSRIPSARSTPSKASAASTSSAQRGSPVASRPGSSPGDARFLSYASPSKRSQHGEGGGASGGGSASPLGASPRPPTPGGRAGGGGGSAHPRPSSAAGAVGSTPGGRPGSAPQKFFLCSDGLLPPSESWEVVSRATGVPVVLHQQAGAKGKNK